MTLAEWSALFVGIAGVFVGLCAYVSDNSRAFLTRACVLLVVISLALATSGALIHGRATAAASQPTAAVSQSSSPEPGGSRPTKPSASSSETPSESPSPSVTPPSPPAGPPVGTPLTSDEEEGDPIITDDGDVYTNVSGVSINGKVFVHSFEAQCQLLCDSQETSLISLNLRRKYRMLKARFGISDDSLSSTKRAAIEVIADGSIIYHRSFGLGQSANVHLNISGVLRLIVRFSGPLGSVYPAVGEPTAYS